MERDQKAAAIAAIYNAAWWVRHYCRPGQERERARALQLLGLACRAAFNATEDFEPIMRALVDALVPRDPRF